MLLNMVSSSLQRGIKSNKLIHCLSSSNVTWKHYILIAFFQTVFSASIITIHFEWGCCNPWLIMLSLEAPCRQCVEFAVMLNCLAVKGHKFSHSYTGVQEVLSEYVNLWPRTRKWAQ